MLDNLLQAAREGEDWAGPSIVTLLMPMLVEYVKEVGRHLPSADQELAVEDAVLRSLKNLDRYDAERAQFTTWVRGYLRFAVADITRKKGGAVEELRDEMPSWLESPLQSEPSDDTSSEGLTWALWDLSITDQVIIALRDFEGLNYSECASRIGGGVTEGACRVRHFRALERLGERLRASEEFSHL